MPTPRQTTLITAAGTSNSPERWSCPGVHAVPGQSELFVITKKVNDPDVLNSLSGHVGQGEQVGSTPPWVPSLLMDLPTLGAFIEANYYRPGDSVFRMECLPEYAVESDGDDYHRWLAGEAEPTWFRKQPWLDELAAARNNDMTHRRVRRFGPTLTDYELYACEWGYALNAEAGEDIRVLRDGEHDVPDLLESEYWVINDGTVVPVLYDGHGRFVGAGVLPSDRAAEFRHDRDAAWAAAEPFAQWWARHPELHRRMAA